MVFNVRFTNEEVKSKPILWLYWLIILLIILIIIQFTAGTSRGATPEGYREAETLRMPDRVAKVSRLRSNDAINPQLFHACLIRISVIWSELFIFQRRGSEFSQPVSTPPHQLQSKRRQSSAQVRSYHEERSTEKTDLTPKRKHDDIPRKTPQPIPEPPEAWRPDPDTIKVTKSQDSPAKRLRQEAEPLKRAKGTTDSPRLTQASHQPRPEHHKSSPNVASRQKSGKISEITWAFK